MTHTRSGPKVGRNDSCPCLSGKKYKKCCLVLLTIDYGPPPFTEETKPEDLPGSPERRMKRRNTMQLVAAAIALGAHR